MPLRNVIIVAIAIVISLACFSAASKSRHANLFAEAMDIVDTEALHPLPRKDLFRSAMSGMLEELDEYSLFISGDDFREFDEDVRQEFGGVGMYVETNPLTDRLFVLAPIPGTPAFDAGLMVGDEILKIDDLDANGMKRPEAIRLLRGPINKPVNLLIERQGETLKKELVRASIPVPSVHGDYRNPDGTWQYQLKENPRIGYLRLIQFGEKSADEISEALEGINGEIDGLIIDLRNNSGGLLRTAIRICDMFIDKDEIIVTTRGRNSESVTRAQSEPVIRSSLPIVLLVNRNSASASEIVAGCLQDHNRAVVVGEQTWGKGTVQDVIAMQRGESALKLTTASYWRPSGRQIDRFDPISQETKVWGVQPNKGYEVEMTEDEVFDNLRHRAMRDLEGLMPQGYQEMFDAIKAKRLQPLRRNNDPPQPDDESKDVVDTVEGDENPETDEKANGEVQPQAPSAKPHIDLPTQKAIEYFESIVNQSQIAA